MLTPKSYEKSVASVVSSILQQIKAVPSMTAADGTALNTAIAASILPKSDKASLAEAVMQSVSTCGPAAAASDNQKGQHLLHPMHYCRRSDIDYVRDHSKSLSQVALRMRTLMNAVGCTRPSEQSFGAVAAFVACLREPDMTPIALHALVMELKQVVSMPKNQFAPGDVVLKVYPESPDKLPTELYDNAYSDESPESIDVPEFGAVYNRCPKRRSHTTVASPSSDSRSSPASVPTIGPDFSASTMMHMFQAFAQKHMTDQSAVSRPVLTLTDGQPLQTDARLPAGGPVQPCPSPDKSESKDGQLAIEDVTGDGNGSGDGDEEAPDIVDELERQAGVSKKPAGVSKKPAGVSKKPAAALKRPIGMLTVPVPALKRPAAAKPTTVRTSTGKVVKLGCSRCRGGSFGCDNCKDPLFKGKRWQAK